MSQTYSLCEVAANNGEHGKPVWLILKGSVYDVTKLLNEHPGGREVIMQFAGKDATKDFNEVGHSADALSDLKMYKIGVVASECMQLSNGKATTATAEAKQQRSDTVECCQTQKKRIKLFFCF